MYFLGLRRSLTLEIKNCQDSKRVVKKLIVISFCSRASCMKKFAFWGLAVFLYCGSFALAMHSGPQAGMNFSHGCLKIFKTTVHHAEL